MSEPSVVLTKSLVVRRSNAVPTLYWWTLPLPVQRVSELYADSLAGARALAVPARALGGTPGLGARDLSNGVALVTECAALLAARDAGAIGPCTIAFFPPGMTAAELEKRAGAMHGNFETLPFTIALRPEGDGRARHAYCFRVPGKVVAAIEYLALQRSFGGNPGQVEMALLQGLRLRPGQSMPLQLLLRDGKAMLTGTGSGGRRRITYLESGLGYTGTYEEMSFGAALQAQGRESWRRFPVGVVLFQGLPFFIAAFWIARWAGRPGARASAAPAPPE
jgi:hypothetical protein